MNTEKSFAIQVLEDKCSKCGECEKNCPFGAIKMNGYPQIDPYACRLCGKCVRTCPDKALLMSDNDSAGNVRKADNSSGIWVFAEVDNGKIAKVTEELLCKASELASVMGWTVEAVLVGSGVEHLAKDLGRYGADRVHLVDEDFLSALVDEDCTEIVVELVQRMHPSVLLVGATPVGRGLSARIASRLGTGLTADCTSLEIDASDGLLKQIRPAFGGNLMATICTPYSRPQMASVRPGVMPRRIVSPDSCAEIVRHDFSSFRRDERIDVLSESIREVQGCNLEDSRIIVGIGRGVKNHRIVDALTEWASKIGASVCGSRAAVECGLVDASLQVGQTGKTVSPDLYIAVGISGQIQHTSGIKGAKKIIAVNPDKNAPIFGMADYGLLMTAEDFLAGTGYKI